MYEQLWVEKYGEISLHCKRSRSRRAKSCGGEGGGGEKRGGGRGRGVKVTPPPPPQLFRSPRTGTPAMQAKLVDEAMFTRCSSSLPGSFTRRAWGRIPPIEGIF